LKSQRKKMITTAKERRKIVVVSGKKATPASVFVSYTARDADSVRAAVRAVLEETARTASRLVTWVVSDLHLGDRLVEEAAGRWTAQRRALGDLLYLERPRPEVVLSARSFFSHVAWTDSRKHWLSPRQMFEVLTLPDAKKYLIGGVVDPQTGTLTVYRGDLSTVTVPLSVFKPTGTGLRPDPTDFRIIDGGQAIRLGSYEATADVIFYEGDPDYRRQLNERRKAQERGLGPALRRLRIQRGLRQTDFGDVPAKTMARIERGEITKPRRHTLAAISRKLGVSPQDIETF
jgi:hypothetical protein